MKKSLVMLFLFLFGMVPDLSAQVVPKDQKISVRLMPVKGFAFRDPRYQLWADTLVNKVLTRKSIDTYKGIVPTGDWIDNGGEIPVIVMDAWMIDGEETFSLSELSFMAKNMNAKYDGILDFDKKFNSDTNSYTTSAIGYYNGNHIVSGNAGQRVTRLVMFFWPITFKPMVDFPFNRLFDIVDQNPFSIRMSVSLGNEISHITLHTDSRLLPPPTKVRTKILAVTGPMGQQKITLALENTEPYTSYVVQVSQGHHWSWGDSVVISPDRTFSTSVFRGSSEFFRVVPQ